MGISSDFSDLLRALNAAGAEYLVIGALAVGFYAEPRATADFDVRIGASRENAARVFRALIDFGAPVSDLTIEDLAQPDLVYMIGAVPFRVDILTTIDGVEFGEAWRHRVQSLIDGVPMAYIGHADLITNKTAVDRDKDRIDVRRLRHHLPEG